MPEFVFWGLNSWTSFMIGVQDGDRRHAGPTPPACRRFRKRSCRRQLACELVVIDVAGLGDRAHQNRRHRRFDRVFRIVVRLLVFRFGEMRFDHETRRRWSGRAASAGATRPGPIPRRRRRRPPPSTTLRCGTGPRSIVDFRPADPRRLSGGSGRRSILVMRALIPGWLKNAAVARHQVRAVDFEGRRRALWGARGRDGGDGGRRGARARLRLRERWRRNAIMGSEAKLAESQAHRRTPNFRHSVRRRTFCHPARKRERAPSRIAPGKTLISLRSSTRNALSDLSAAVEISVLPSGENARRRMASS